MNHLVGLMIAALAFAIIMIVGFLYIAIFYYSKRDTFVSPRMKGEVKVATISGSPWKFFGSIPPGKYLDATGKVAEGIRHIDPVTGVMRQGAEKVTLLHKLFKVEWIGLPPYGGIHNWVFSYSKWGQTEDGTVKLIIVKDKPVNSLHILPTFAFMVIGAETKDKIQLNIKGKYTLALIDAMAALFTTKNWRLNIETALIAAIVDFVKARSFDDFLAKPLELGVDPVLNIPNSGFVREMLTLNDDTVGGNRSIRRYGFVLEDVSVMTVEIAGSNNEEILKATTALTVAKKNAGAKAATSKGDLAAAKNEAKGIEAMIKALGTNSNQIGLVVLSKAIGAHQGPLGLGGTVLSNVDLTSATKSGGTP